jgi:hypothetical protein
MVDVDVDVENPSDLEVLAEELDRDPDVVEDTEPGRRLPGRMMEPAHRVEGVCDLSRHDLLDRRNCGPYSVLGSLEDSLVGRSVPLVEGAVPEIRGELDVTDVLRGVEQADELLVGLLGRDVLDI